MHHLHPPCLSFVALWVILWDEGLKGCVQSEWVILIPGRVINMTRTHSH